eukprot:4280143-Prymnesium_polylepis.1
MGVASETVVVKATKPRRRTTRSTSGWARSPVDRRASSGFCERRLSVSGSVVHDDVELIEAGSSSQSASSASSGGLSTSGYEQSRWSVMRPTTACIGGVPWIPGVS